MDQARKPSHLGFSGSRRAQPGHPALPSLPGLRSGSRFSPGRLRPASSPPHRAHPALLVPMTPWPPPTRTLRPNLICQETLTKPETTSLSGSKPCWIKYNDSSLVLRALPSGPRWSSILPNSCQIFCSRKPLSVQHLVPCALLPVGLSFNSRYYWVSSMYDAGD